MDIKYLISTFVIICYWLLVISITLRLVLKRQSMSSMLAWLMLIYIVPFVGIFIYIILGEIQLGRKYLRRSKKNLCYFDDWLTKFNQLNPIELPKENLSPASLAFFKICTEQLKFPPLNSDKITLISEPTQIINQIITDISQAKISIKMEFYIWQQDGLIEKLTAELIKARQRNVQIKILLDSVGSKHFLKSIACKRLQSYGIEIAEALPVHIFRMQFQRIDIRQHRKIIIIDENIAYTGSMNMVDPRFFKKGAGAGAWVDIMVRLESQVGAFLETIHAWDWQIETKNNQQDIQVLLPEVPKIKTIPTIEKPLLQILPSGPNILQEDLISQTLLTILYSAQKEIIITTPYFVPSYNIIEALKAAVMRGVAVTIIIPQKNDSHMVEWASHNYFDELLLLNINILLFQHNLLHTKSIIIDDELTLVGSVNMDFRSFQINFELTLAIHDVTFNQNMRQKITEYIAQTVPLDKDRWLQRPVWRRIIERLFFIFSPLL